MTDTVLVVGMNIVATTSSNLIDPDDTSPLTEESIKDREFGSKMVLVVEQMQCITIWLVKACLLLMYHRLTCASPPPLSSSSPPPNPSQPASPLACVGSFSDRSVSVG